MRTNDIFFTSDSHFSHANIINLCKRPFKDVNEMNEALIEKWNAKVKPNNEVYHLGDFAYRSGPELEDIVNRLNGRIYLIKGNHEKAVLSNSKIKSRFEWIKDYYELSINDKDANNGIQKICLFHYSQRSWNGSYRGAWHLFGHSHGNLDEEPWGLSFDIGVDSNNFEPLSYQEVKNIMKTKIPNPR